MKEHTLNLKMGSTLPNLTPWGKFVGLMKQTFQGFVNDDCYSKASALTFYTLLSIVPVLAVLFGIAKGFGFETKLEEQLNQNFVEQREIIQKLIGFAYSWLNSVRGGLIAGIGAATLLWSVFALLNNIENALNSIWKTFVPRSFFRKLGDYLATMLVAPILFVTSSSVTVFLSTELSKSTENSVVLQTLSPFIEFLLKLSPFFLSATLFTFLIMMLPNVKVFFRSACLAGIIGGVAFQFWQWFYIRFQIEISSYGAIYGSFAALPLFLIWVQVSWLILLCSAEIAFQLENILFLTKNRIQIFLTIKEAALLITYKCVKAFAKGEKPITDRDLSYETGLPLYQVRSLLQILLEGGILSAVYSEIHTIGYQPARSIDAIDYGLVIRAVESSELMRASVNSVEDILQIQKKLDLLSQEELENYSSVLLYRG